MKRNRKQKHSVGMADKRLLMLAICFLLGAVGGSLCCSRFDWLAEGALRRITGECGVWQALWPDLILLAALLLGAFWRFGCMAALAVLGAKGFFLSLSATALVQELGTKGYAASLLLQFLPGALTLAAVLLLSMQTLSLSVQRLTLPPGKSKKIHIDSAFFLTAGICAVVLLLAALLQVYATPLLRQATATFLPL